MMKNDLATFPLIAANMVEVQIDIQGFTVVVFVLLLFTCSYHSEGAAHV